VNPETSEPKVGAGKIVARRGIAGQILVWVDGWCVRRVRYDADLTYIYANLSGARLSGEWFDKAVYEAISELLILEGRS